MLHVSALLLGLVEVRGGRCPCAERGKVKAVCVWHGQDSDPFWQDMKMAAQWAAVNMGIDLSVRLFEHFDEEKMAAVVEEEAMKEPSFMVVSLPGPKVVAKVKALKLPVFAVNAGYDVAADAGIINFVGQNGQRAGVMAGQKLMKELPGMTKGVFINAEKGNAAMAARSAGVKQAMAAAGVAFEELSVPRGDEEGLKSTLQERLTADGPFGVVIGDGSAVSAVVAHLKAVQYKTAAVTFDPNDSVFASIKAGDLVAAIDQQPWLQGFLPVVLGTLYISTGEGIGQTVLRTGPRLETTWVTAEQAACIGRGKCVDLKEKIVAVVVGAVANDPFWDKLRKGAEAAAKDMGVRLSFDRPPSPEGTMPWIQKQLQTKSGSSDALVLDPSEKALGPAVKAAAAKLPTIGVTAGGPEAARLGCLTFVGRNQTRAGEDAGKRLVSSKNCKAPVCILHNAKQRMFARRCEGFFQGSVATGATPKAKFVEVGVDKESIKKKLRDLVARESPDCVLLTEQSLLEAWKEATLAPGPSLVVFDLTQQAVESLARREVDFLLDEQAYMQGYLSVLLLAVKLQTGLQLMDTWVHTGGGLDTATIMDAQRFECISEGFPVCGGRPLLQAFEVSGRMPDAPRAVSANLTSLAEGGLCMAAVGLALAAVLMRRRSRASGTVGGGLREPLE